MSAAKKKKNNHKNKVNNSKDKNVEKNTESLDKETNKLEEKETLENNSVKENSNDVKEENVKTKEEKAENEVKENSENSKDKKDNKTSKANSQKDSEKEIQNEESSEKEDEKNNTAKEESNQSNNKDKEDDEKATSNIENKDESKDLVVVKNNDEEAPDYVKEMIRKRKRKMYIAISIIVLVVLVILFSTIFAILNIKNSNFIKGIEVKNIDISNLTIEEAEEKVKNIIDNTLAPEITLKYGEEYNITLKPEQIEFKYKIKDSLVNAFNIGRDGNIVQNNYTLLLTTFFGKNIDLEYTYNEELLNNFIDDVNSKLPGLVVEPSYYIEGTDLIISKGKNGIQIEKDKLKKNILNSINNRNITETSNPEYKQIIEIPTENVSAQKIDIEKIYSEVHKDPQDAYYETNPYKIYTDVDGIDFNISLDEAKNIIQSEDKEEYTIPLKITKASKTIKDLGKEAFPYLVSSFSTKYDASNRNRSTNLEIAAKKINGTVLMPGDVFSFNKVVGKRTVEEGYKDAKIYADGGVVDGLAGGICQISSTLYNAVLLGNLEIVERRNHSFPTSYVKTGRDATVVYGVIDFQFKNSRSYPIKIEASVKNGIAEFQIHGMQEEKEYEIRILPVTTQSIPYSTSFIQDATLIPGQQVIVQAGQPGYKVTTYIEKRLNGELVSKEILSNDTYSPMKAIVRVGAPAPVPAPVPVQ